MKTYRVVTLATLAAAAAGLPLPSVAQSSVTIYGLMDLYLQYGKGTTRQTQLQSGGMNGSRLGFRGTEDLGGGLRALFQLEMGLNADAGTSGQGGATFGRQSYVGLQSTQWGQLNLGRQYTPLFTAVDAFDPFGTGLGSAVQSNIVSTVPRANNAVLYKSPSLAGFSGQAMVALGENANAGQKSFGNLYAVSAQYSAGPFSAAVVSQQQKRTAVTGRDTRWLLAGASYDFGVLKVLGGVQSVKNLDIGTLSGGSTASYDDRLEGHVGVKIPVSASGTVTASLAGSRADTLKGFGAAEWSVGYAHALSKRTTLYGIGSHINNGSASNWTTGGATGAGPATVAGKDVSAVQLGMRHTF